MKNIFNLLILVYFLFPSLAIAEIKEIICEGTYNMGDGETPTVAESRAILNAKRTALEEAGTYVESYSRVKNFQLTEDEIKVLASGLMEVTVIEKKRTVVGDSFKFWGKRGRWCKDNLLHVLIHIKTLHRIRHPIQQRSPHPREPMFLLGSDPAKILSF